MAASQRRADHHRVRPAGDGLGDVAAVAHATVGDDLHVLPGLEHVLGARGGHVGDRRRLGHADAQHTSRRARGAGPHAHQHPGSPRAHEVQTGAVARAPADHDGHRDLAGELLQVERLDDRRDVLGRDHRALDDQDVKPCLERDLVVVAHALGGQRRRDDDALGLDLLDPPADELGLERLAVDLLHLARGELRGEAGDALELLVRVLEARPDPFEVQDGEAAEPADDARGVGRDHAVHRRGQQRELEAVGPERPGDVDVVGIARAPGGHDGDVVEAVCTPRLLATADLYFHRAILGLEADEKTPLRGGAGRRFAQFAGRTTTRSEGSNALADDRKAGVLREPSTGSCGCARGAAARTPLAAGRSRR